MSRPAPVVPSITPEQAAALRKLTEEKFIPEMMKAQALVMEMAAASLNPAQSGYIRRRSHYLILLVVVVVAILAVLVGMVLLIKGFSTGVPTAVPAAGPPPSTATPPVLATSSPRPVTPTLAPVVLTPLVCTDFFTISVSAANLRKGPGTGYQVLRRALQRGKT